MADFRKLAELGMIPALAKRLAAQIDAKAADVRVLTELGMATVIARLVARQIASGVGSAKQFTELGVSPKLADEIASQISASVPSTTFGLAANRNQVPSNTNSYPDLYTSRRMHYASGAGAISGLVFVELGWYIDNTSKQEANAVARTIKKFVEYPEGVFTQVTYGGNPTVVVPAGGQVLSDPVNITIPTGAKFWERTVNVSGAAVVFPVLVLPRGSTILGVDDGNSTTDQGNSGTIAATTGVNTFGSSAIMGNISAAASAVRGIVVHGDSIVLGTGDETGVGTKGGSAWVARMLDATTTPYVKIAQGGQRANQATAVSTRQRAFINALTYTDVIIELGINDVTNGETQSSILGSRTTIAGWHTSKRLWHTTLTPRSESTDSYMTVANQTPKTDGNMVNLNNINAALRAMPNGAYGVLDAADAAMSARDSGVWKAPPQPTTDGTHPLTDMAQLMADLMRPSFAV